MRLFKTETTKNCAMTVPRPAFAAKLTSLTVRLVNSAQLIENKDVLEDSG